jgi:hypothetical protein
MIGTSTPITPRMKKTIAHARLWALLRGLRRVFFLPAGLIRPEVYLTIEDCRLTIDD